MRELVVVPLGDLPAELGVAAATDQLDLVCHLGGHGEQEESGQRPDDGDSQSFLCFLLQVLLAGSPTAGQRQGCCAVWRVQNVPAEYGIQGVVGVRVVCTLGGVRCAGGRREAGPGEDWEDAGVSNPDGGWRRHC